MLVVILHQMMHTYILEQRPVLLNSIRSSFKLIKQKSLFVNFVKVSTPSRSLIEILETKTIGILLFFHRWCIS